MKVTPPVSAPTARDEFVALRHSLHAAPELGHAEVGTSALVARLLEGWGYDVATGVGGTGVVATLINGAGERRPPPSATAPPRQWPAEARRASTTPG